MAGQLVRARKALLAGGEGALVGTLAGVGADVASLVLKAVEGLVADVASVGTRSVLATPGGRRRLFGRSGDRGGVEGDHHGHGGVVGGGGVAVAVAVEQKMADSRLDIGLEQEELDEEEERNQKPEAAPEERRALYISGPSLSMGQKSGDKQG